MYSTVIFDWDGTLADSRQVLVEAFQIAVKELNIQVSDEFVARRIGVGAAETFREILKDAKVSFDEDTVRKLVNHKIELCNQLSDKVKLMAGARELLVALKGKVTMGLASMNNRMVINQLLKINNLDDFFKIVLSAEDISNSKPNPEIFLKCAQKLGSKPDETVVVEDSLFGVQAAKAAGMDCIAVTTGVYSEAELETQKPDLIVKSLKDKRITKLILF